MIAVLVLVLGLALLEYILDCRTMLEELLCPLTNQPAQVTQATPHPAFRASTANSASTSAANSALHRRNLASNPCPQCVLNGGRESTSINASYQCFCQIRSNKYTNSNYWLGILGWILSTESGVHHLEG